MDRQKGIFSKNTCYTCFPRMVLNKGWRWGIYCVKGVRVHNLQKFIMHIFHLFLFICLFPLLFPFICFSQGKGV
jgi:hypothetical protein